jgi:hypothetical protein
MVVIYVSSRFALAHGVPLPNVRLVSSAYISTLSIVTKTQLNAILSLRNSGTGGIIGMQGVRQ